MLLNLRKDFQRYCKRATPVFQRDSRIAARPDRLQERANLRAQRLLLLDRGLKNFDLRIRRGLAGAVTNCEDHHILAAVINRNILLRLEKSQLAHTLGRDPAGSEVSDTSRLELNSRVRDVDLVGQDWDSGGANFLYRGIHEGQH